MSEFITILATNNLKIRAGFWTVKIAALCKLQIITVSRTMDIGINPFPKAKVVITATDPMQVERMIPKAEYPIIFWVKSFWSFEIAVIALLF